MECLFHIAGLIKPNSRDLDSFQANFTDIAKEEQVRKVHDMLGPHILRRMKVDVLKNMPSKSEFIIHTYLSKGLKEFYNRVLTKNFDALRTKNGASSSLLNVMMELKRSQMG